MLSAICTGLSTRVITYRTLGDLLNLSCLVEPRSSPRPPRVYRDLRTHGPIRLVDSRGQPYPVTKDFSELVPIAPLPCQNRWCCHVPP